MSTDRSKLDGENTDSESASERLGDVVIENR